MTTNQADSTHEELPQAGRQATQDGAQNRREIFIWLALMPIIVGLLVLCGQVALLFSLDRSSANTQSLLRASYEAWLYDLIPPINIPQLIEDIEEDLRAEGIEEEPLPVVTGDFWVPPTPTDTAEPPPTPTQPIIFPSDTPEPKPDNPTAAAPTRTRTPAPTALPPTATITPSRTNTLAPLFTSTEIPREPTSTRTRTPVPSPTTRPSNTPKPTNTKPPTNTPITPPPPTIAPLQRVEPLFDSSEANPDGSASCIATFGYHNNNPQAISIPPLTSQNQINIDKDFYGNPVLPPDTFQAGGAVHGAFKVTWGNKENLRWELDGNTAVAPWCNPPGGGNSSYPYPYP